MGETEGSGAALRAHVSSQPDPSPPSWMTENAKSMRFAAKWNTECISMTPFSQLDALR